MNLRKNVYSVAIEKDDGKHGVGKPIDMNHHYRYSFLEILAWNELIQEKSAFRLWILILMIICHRSLI